MRNSELLVSVAFGAVFAVSSAWAGEKADDAGHSLTVEQASQYLHYSGGNDRMRVEIAPNYSEELGFSLKGAVGSYLTDEIALGLIVEYGEHKREYLANAGIQFTDALSFVGTVGMLEEHNEYAAGEGREVVQQMEYGASLKGAHEIGFLSGFELNGYLADADADSDSVETGKLYGVQLLADLDLTDTTHIKLGGGYEWLEWKDTNEDDSSWAASVEAAQQLGDALSLTGHARLGASEYVYGGGLAYDLSNDGPNTNTIGVNYSYIDGRNGIEDDQRVELSWTVGFGAGPTSSVAAADLTDKSGTIRAAADVTMVSPANNLLNDVMQRPAFLPERVLARKVAGTVECTLAFTLEQDRGSGSIFRGADDYDNSLTLYVATLSGSSDPSNLIWTLNSSSVNSVDQAAAFGELPKVASTYVQGGSFGFPNSFATVGWQQNGASVGYDAGAGEEIFSVSVEDPATNCVATQTLTVDFS